MPLVLHIGFGNLAHQPDPNITNTSKSDPFLGGVVSDLFLFIIFLYISDVGKKSQSSLLRKLSNTAKFKFRASMSKPYTGRNVNSVENPFLARRPNTSRLNTHPAHSPAKAL